MVIDKNIKPPYLIHSDIRYLRNLIKTRYGIISRHDIFKYHFDYLCEVFGR